MTLERFQQKWLPLLRFGRATTQEVKLTYMVIICTSVLD